MRKTPNAVNSREKREKDGDVGKEVGRDEERDGERREGRTAYSSQYLVTAPAGEVITHRSLRALTSFIGPF